MRQNAAPISQRARSQAGAYHALGAALVFALIAISSIAGLNLLHPAAYARPQQLPAGNLSAPAAYFTENGLPQGQQWEIAIYGSYLRQPLTLKGNSVQMSVPANSLPNGNYTFNASSAGYQNVAGNVLLGIDNPVSFMIAPKAAPGSSRAGTAIVQVSSDHNTSISSTQSTTTSQPTTTANATTTIAPANSTTSVPQNVTAATSQPTTTANATTTIAPENSTTSAPQNVTAATSQPTTTANATTTIAPANSTTSVPQNVIAATSQPTTTANATTTIAPSNSTTSALQNTTTSVLPVIPNALQTGNAVQAGSISSLYSLSHVSGPSLQQFDSAQPLNATEIASIGRIAASSGERIPVYNVSYPYGSIENAGSIQPAGSTMYFLSGNSSSTLEYAVHVTKAVPQLTIGLGATSVNSTTNSLSVLMSPYSRKGNLLVIEPNMSITANISSSIQRANMLNYTYYVYEGNTILRHRTIDSNGLERSIAIAGIPAGTSGKIVFEAQGNANYTSVDPTLYYTVADANLQITSSQTLASDLVVGSVTIASGVTLTTDGYNIYANSVVTNDGTILAGNPGNGGAAGSPGTSETSSYAGSGGGGGGYNNAGSPGGTPGAPAMSNANIDTWYAGGFSNYLTAAGGGGSADVSGGSGSYGVYIQANQIIAGTVNTVGIGGTSDTSSTKTAGQNGGATLVSGGAGGASSGHGAANNAGGGGGGGGVIMLAYGSGGYTAGTYTYSGGLGGNQGQTAVGGTGGNGQVATFNYASNSPIVVLEGPSVTLTYSPSAAYYTVGSTEV